MAAENDIVLVYIENKPLFFARIEAISPDIKRDWYHVKLLILQVPVQTITWILKDLYINGAEFTMGGKGMRLEKVEAPADSDAEIQEIPPPPESPEKKSSGSVISFAERKPKK